MRNGAKWARPGFILSPALLGGVPHLALHRRDAYIAAMERGERRMMVLARLRTAPLVLWQLACLGLAALLLNELDWSARPADMARNMVFGHPVVTVLIAVVLCASAYGIDLWRRRKAYVRHDGTRLYRGTGLSWPLAAIRDVIVTRSELGIESLRLVVDDDSETTRELVKLYMLADRPDVVRDAILFVVAGRRPS